MENQKGLNCNICEHKEVCKNKTLNKEAWERMTLSEDFQSLQRRDFVVSVICKYYKPMEGKIFRGELHV